MLSGLNQNHLSRTILPLGTLKKADLRQKARQMQLSVADKEDSQDLCFLGNQDYRDFLKQHSPEVIQPGNIVTRNGSLVGKHEGLAFYTIGQRKGLGLSSPEPMYVLDKQVESNCLVVGPEEDLGNSELVADQFNWISGTPITEPLKLMVKIRYRAEFHPAVVEAVGTESATMRFEERMRDITPGQVAVVYDGDTVIGSGIIRL